MGKNIGFFVSDDRIQKFDPCKCMNKIINFFKNIFWYIIKEVCTVLLYLLKYTPVVGRVVQEEYNREVLKQRRFLKFIADIFKTQQMRNKEIEKDRCVLRFAPFHFWTNVMTNKAIEKYICQMIMSDYLNTQELCERVVENNPYMLKFVPGHYKIKEMCNKVVKKDDRYFLQYVPNWFVTREQIQMGHDAYYDNFFLRSGMKAIKKQGSKSLNKRRTFAYCLASIKVVVLVCS